MLEAKNDSSGSYDLVFGTNLFTNHEPANPTNCVTIFDYSGQNPWLGVDGNVGYEYPSIQIRVRNRKQVDAWNIIENIKDSLHGKAQETWNGTLYSLIRSIGSPALLDWDTNGNVRLIINFNIQRRSV
jgi:hypothetical protein